ncbi:DUF1669 domain-containing protein [Silvanigrella paludirubra]|uniref:phospholipase D n=1 Tax=Silvanigrella paludirubra TaxID=2499159 RepID=A0A6N6W0T2_9BACT|nr:phospholipase D-like domain-containing protein [Silvanigrella paludirubra]KAB8040968.1 DUF1669 domain-containing protein [Silvanigrella paludirubra]
MHKNCFRIFFVSVVMSAPFSLNAIPVKLSNQNASLGFSPNLGAIDVILKAINEAQSSINLAAFVITSDDIFNALVDAHQRGVNVRVVVDAKSANGNGSDVQALLDANIPVVLNNEFKIMHNKYIIIDNKSVQTGSFNYSNNADKRNAENALFIENQPAIAKLYTNNFERLFSNSKKIPNSKSKSLNFSFIKENVTKFPISGLSTFQIQKGVVEIAFSNACNYITSSPSAKTIIIQTIKQAKNNIYMAAYDFTDSDILNALKNRQNNGVQLNIVLDYKANLNNDAVQDLMNAGANISLNKKFSIMHNKYMIIDNSTLDFGSFNYTTSAENEQCNNIMVFYNQSSLVENYMNDWNMLYQTSIKNL